MTTAPKLLLAGALLLAVGAGVGWCAGRRRLEGKLAADTAAAWAASRTADSTLAAKTSDYELYRATSESRITGLLHRSDSLQRQAARHARQDRGQDSVLAAAQSAADSIPILVDQRDQVRLAYRFASAAADSLRQVADSFAVLVSRGDSLLADTRQAQAVREAALLSQLASVRVALERERDKGKLLGFIPAPSRTVMLLIGAAAGFCAAKC